MKNKDKIVIAKINNYISDIENFIYNMNSEDFFNDKKTITACAFTVSQIGELVKEISEDTINTYTDIPWRSIKGMRNKIVHDYENIDFSVLWGTINESLPELRKQLIKIIASYSERRRLELDWDK